MLLQILTHTPKWVFAVFALLFWVGCKQLLSRRVSLTRITVMPVVMTVFSFYGLISVFGDTPSALIAWAGAGVALAVVVMQRALPASTRYDAASRSFDVAGSAVPLLLMMGIFFTKYVVGVQIAMQPGLAHHANFALTIGALYGAFSGIFAARAARLWRLALQQDRALADGAATA